MVVSQLAPPFAVQEFRAADVAANRSFSCAIEVWHCINDVSDRELDYFRTLLSADEVERAARFRFEADRNNYVLSRGGLRHLLAAYLAASPKEIRFKYSAYGKPMLDHGFDSDG